MSTPYVEPIRNCHNCGAALSLGVLACPQCHTLIHSEELLRISSRAKSLEEAGQLLEARQEWLNAAALLPPDATQAQWIQEKTRKLQLAAAANPREQKHAWAKRLGPLAPIAILLAKSKLLLLSLFKLKFLFTFFLAIGVYWRLFGAAFGVGVAVLILVHEMGHYVDIRRRGLPADMPVFLPGLGAYVRWTALGVTRQTRAAVSLAGPFAGFLGAAACVLLWYRTHHAFWAALARFTAGLNVLNLIPVWVLDGQQATTALSKAERYVLLTACLLIFAFSREGIFLLVAGGLVYRLFTRDLPPQPSPGIAVYFAAVLAALGFVIWLTPGHGILGPATP